MKYCDEKRQSMENKKTKDIEPSESDTELSGDENVINISKRCIGHNALKNRPCSNPVKNYYPYCGHH